MQEWNLLLEIARIPKNSVFLFMQKNCNSSEAERVMFKMNWNKYLVHFPY